MKNEQTTLVGTTLKILNYSFVCNSIEDSSYGGTLKCTCTFDSDESNYVQAWLNYITLNAYLVYFGDDVKIKINDIDKVYHFSESPYHKSLTAVKINGTLTNDGSKDVSGIWVTSIAKIEDILAVTFSFDEIKENEE